MLSSLKTAIQARSVELNHNFLWVKEVKKEEGGKERRKGRAKEKKERKKKTKERREKKKERKIPIPPVPAIAVNLFRNELSPLQSVSIA